MSTPIEPGVVLVLSLVPEDASTTLFFKHLQRRMPGRIRVVRYGRDRIAGLLARASALVVVRGLFECQDVVACARALGVPRYYFLDDNFMLLAQGQVEWGPYYAAYSNDGVRAALGDFAGVLLASPALVEYFRDRGLHSSLHLFPPVSDGERAETHVKPLRALTVAYFAGAHRRPYFLRLVLPAIRRVAETHPVRLIAPGVELTADLLSPGVTMVDVPYDPSYARALDRLAREGVTVVVHPGDTTPGNNRYKNLHTLISADALGAVPVASDGPPYDVLHGQGVVELCADSPESWFSVLRRLADEPGYRTAMQARLAQYCARHFDGAENLRVLEDVLARHEAPRRWQVLRRRPQASACLSVALASRLAAGLRRRWHRRRGLTSSRAEMLAPEAGSQRPEGRSLRPAERGNTTTD